MGPHTQRQHAQGTGRQVRSTLEALHAQLQRATPALGRQGSIRALLLLIGAQTKDGMLLQKLVSVLPVNAAAPRRRQGGKTRPLLTTACAASSLQLNPPNHT